MISIIIPVYNGEKTIIKTLESIASQDYRDLEVIIINDGSKDGTEAVVANYLSQIKNNISYYFYNQANQGAPSARNYGHSFAKGQFLLFCDADVVLAPHALAKMEKALLENPEASYVYSSFNWGKKLYRLNHFDPAKLKRMPYIHSVSLIRAKDFPASGWDESIKKFQDWDLWLTMLAQGKTGLWLPEVLFTVKPGGTISSWLPSFAYKLFPFLPAVKKYKQAMAVIKQKHELK